jgi:glycosyltransferase involved in cell wall biosynthesis
MIALFELFDKVTLIAPQGQLGKEFNKLSYYDDTTNLANLSYVPSPKVGGNSIIDKLKIIKTIFIWLVLFWKHKNNDLIYLRMPNNLNIFSFLLYRILSKKILITYTGTWKDYNGEPLTYRLQKWFISNLQNGVSFIYSPTVISHLYEGRIIESFSPSNSRVEIDNMQKLRTHKKINMNCIKLLSVGAVVRYKNQLKSLEIVKFLNEQGIHTEISFAGKLSDYHKELLLFIKKYQLLDKVIFHGQLSFKELHNLYISHDFLIHTPTIEGYGKTIQEGFMYGLPAIVTDFTYADYFKGNTNRVYILKDTADSYIGLLDFIKQYYTSTNFRITVQQDINTFLHEHSIEHWIDQYKKAIQKKLIVSNVS